MNPCIRMTGSCGVVCALTLMFGCGSNARSNQSAAGAPADASGGAQVAGGSAGLASNAGAGLGGNAGVSSGGNAGVSSGGRDGTNSGGRGGTNSGGRGGTSSNESGGVNVGGSLTGGAPGAGGAVAAGGTGAGGAAGNAGTGGKATRPTYNTGSGFFTLNGKLYDANGVEFRAMGVDTSHFDENWASCTTNCGLPNARVNVNRMGVPLWSAIADTTLQNLMQKMIGQRIVPIAGVWFVDGSYADASNVTCKEDASAGSAFAIAVSQWVAREPLFKAFEKDMLLNIANEWGPTNSAGWRDAYVSAVASLRQAGYLCTLVVDAGGCGQDATDIVNYAQAVYDSDPQHNIVFDVHIYGNWATQASGESSFQTDLTSGLDQLKATGLPILVGEFGPGNDIGPSPTRLTPGTIIQAANARGLGWIAWAWDDGYGRGDTWFELSNQGAFSLSGGVPVNGGYPNNSDLSAFGNEVVLNPSYGTFVNARAATIF